MDFILLSKYTSYTDRTVDFKSFPLVFWLVKKEEEDDSGTGYEDGQYPFNRAVLGHIKNNKTTHFRSSRLITTTG